MRSVLPVNTMAIAMGLHARCGNEDTIWGRKGEKMTSVQQVEQVVRIADELGREVATGKEARDIYRIGETYGSVDETLAQARLRAQPQARPARLHLPRLSTRPTRQARTGPDRGAACHRTRAPPTRLIADDPVRALTRLTFGAPDATARHRRPRASVPDHRRQQRPGRRVFPLLVFALTFGLLLSDYMSRQVLSAVFPFLKVEWALTDTQLGALTSIVALTVGLLAVPLSLLGDRWGRSKAIVAMGALWSLATLGSAVAANYDQMMLARLFVGLGEAAYGSVGLAVVLMVFSPARRASLSGAFMAGGSFGSVLGVFLGGILAVHLGWRWSFGVMALLGLVLVALYLLLVNDAKLARNQHPGNLPTGTASGRVRRAQAAHPGLHPLGDLRLPRQRPAAVHRRLAVRLDAQLPQPRLRARPRQGGDRGRRLHPADGRRHDRVRHGHRPAHPHPADPQVDHRARLLRAVAGAAAAWASPRTRARCSWC